MRKQKAGIAVGTDIRNKNICFGNSRRKQHLAVRLPEIQLILSILLPVKQPAVQLFWKFIGKSLDHLFANLIAVPANAGADTAKNIFRRRAEFLLHLKKRRLSHAVYRSPPAGMGKTDGLLFLIEEIKGNTVGKKSNQHQSRHIGDQAVHIPVIPVNKNPFSRVRLLCPPDVCRMGLPSQHHPMLINSQGSGHPPVIFSYRLRIVAAGKRKIHRCIGAFTDAAHAGRKGMVHQSRFFQRGKA